MFATQSSRSTIGVRKRDSEKRRGAIAVLSALLLVFMLALVAFAVDLGIIYSAHTEMKRATDAAALAGAGALIEGEDAANIMALEFFVRNPVGNVFLAEDDEQWLNNLDAFLAQHQDEISFTTNVGHWDPEERDIVATDDPPSAIHVQVSRPGLPLFFAKMFGGHEYTVAAESIAQYQPRDIVLVLDYSASMNDDSELKRIGSRGQNREAVESNLEEIYEDMGPMSYGSMQFEPQYISSTNNTTIKKNLGLRYKEGSRWQEVPYPYPSGSWDGYINYVKSSSNVNRAGYRKSYGYMTLINYWLEQKPTHAQTPDLWKADAQPIGAVKDAVGMFLEYILEVDTDDRVALVIYNSSNQKALVEYSLSNYPVDDNPPGGEPGEPDTGRFYPVWDIVKHRQAGHYDHYTNIGDGIRYARKQLDDYSRPGAFKMIVLMTDGQANRPSGVNARQYAIDMAGHTDGGNDENGVHDYVYTNAVSPDAPGRVYKTMTISLGINADENLMQTIADNTGGRHFNIPGLTEVTDYRDDLRETFRKIARDRPLILVK